MRASVSDQHIIRVQKVLCGITATSRPSFKMTMNFRASRRFLPISVKRATETKEPLLLLARSFSSSRDDKNPSQSHADFMQQLKELNEERQALFGFTREEEIAWSSAKVHSSTLMDAVEEVRRRQVTETTTLDTPDYRQEEAVEQQCTSFPPKSLHTQLHQYNIPEEELLFSHVDAGNAVTMVDVGSKQVSRRTARAQSQVVFPPEVMAAFELRGEELIGPKGPIFATAKLAGIMAAKRTSDLIPLCHPLPLDKVHVDIRLEGNTAIVECECRVTHKTGVEMEALTGASVAALVIYDMVKAVSHRVMIRETVLLRKTGGKRNVLPEDKSST